MVPFSRENLPVIATTVVTALGTTFTAGLIIRNIAQDLVPDSISLYVKKLRDRLLPKLTVVIQDFDGLTPNQLFNAASVYLSTKITPSTARIKAHIAEKDESLIVTVDKNQDIVDRFDNIKLVWVLNSTPVFENNEKKSETKFFELSFDKKHRDFVLKSYLPYVLKKAKEIREESKAVKLHTVDYNGKDYWGSVVLNHPATFDTMAMEREVKRDLMEDLNVFVNRKDYYRRVGKAWKRGYLLYGPPGTGKSSLVAAMANYLKFDVYDLDLREVQCNSDLRRLLIGSGNKSILVIEDIDCNVGVISREGESNNQAAEDDKITLSGLLNFIDGLWSSCGDEKIIIFTTNHKDRLDPALLRPGRMDMHIHMSYCTFEGFKTLAQNYLKIDNHPFFGSVEELLVKAKATPAELAEVLMKNEDPVIALGNVIKFLKEKGYVHLKNLHDSLI